ncbi:CerR family C-terminal domain-containing protein [uncultured Sphingomonas sp.]|uniref:CerR family C-terminal domain-containing protein n=1 Tax=uncultured Sphingomonas sp. TaxID=158754 RepID=UPI0035C9F610
MQARLLEVAIAEFGSKGLDGASTRGIAARAGTAMSSITYHYGGKEGLYLAAADHIGRRMGEEMADLLEPSDVDDREPVAARVAIQRTMERFADRMAGHATDGWALFVAREQMHPGAAFDRLFDGGMGRMLNRLVDLVRIAVGPMERHTAAIASVTLFGQVLALRSSRAACLRLLGADELSGAVLDDLKRRIAANTDAMLDRLAVEARETRP